MRIPGLVLLLACLSIAVHGQNIEPPPGFDITGFNEKVEVANWLLEYDFVAWRSTDLILALPEEERKNLGAEWFCFQDEDGVWHAVYGKLENEKYTVGFHFKQNADSKIVKTDDSVPTEFLTLHARALATANAAVSKAIDRSRSPRFNQYIRRDKDMNFTVWILPAFQTNGLTVYGGEFIYEIDKTGTKITKDRTYKQENFRAFKPDPSSEVFLVFEELDQPPLNAVFFVLYYQKYFKRITIKNRKSISTLISLGEGNPTWLHVERESKKSDLK